MHTNTLLATYNQLIEIFYVSAFYICYVYILKHLRTTEYFNFQKETDRFILLSGL